MVNMNSTILITFLLVTGFCTQAKEATEQQKNSVDESIKDVKMENIPEEEIMEQ